MNQLSDLARRCNALEQQMADLREFHRARDLNNEADSPEIRQRLARAMERVKIPVDSGEPPVVR